jgi:hypothetical protein
MKKQNFISILLTVVVASATIIGSVYAFNYWRSSEQKTPEQTVNQFFSEWVEYKGNPIVDRYYAHSPLIDKTYVEKVDMIITSFDKSGFDPILCSQDFPERIEITNTAIKDGNAVVSINKVFSGNSLMAEVILKQKNGKWLINDIICQEGQKKEDSLNSGVSPAIQTQVSEYIRENISELSPEEAILGGSFYVNSIRFTGPYMAIVDYEDGHIALSAEVEFNVPKAGEIEIVSFKLKEDDISLFEKIGNLTKNNDNWNLVYEEAGKPALTVILEFNENSQCFDNYEDNSCLPVYWQVGDRAQLKGKYEADKVIVREMSIIGESSRKINEGLKVDYLPVSNFEECLIAGNEKMEPDCINCKAYCETEDGQRFEEEVNKTGDSFCEDLCGDGVCQEIVCLAEACPCAESPVSCPEDCVE